MTNTFALTDEDVYQENDNFLGTVIAGRYIRKRIRRKRRKRKNKRKKLVRPKLSRPPRQIRPKVIKGRTTKVLSKPKKNLVPIRKKKQPVKPSITIPKNSLKPKVKTPIEVLIKKTNPIEVKTPLTKASIAEVKQIKNSIEEAVEKPTYQNRKVGSVVKLIAIAGVIGITGFGVYKYFQHQKTRVTTNKINQE